MQRVVGQVHGEADSIVRESWQLGSCFLNRMTSGADPGSHCLYDALAEPSDVPTDTV